MSRMSIHTTTHGKFTVKKMGWSNKLKISCYNCCWSKEMFTSKMIDKGTSSGQKGYEVNTYSVSYGIS